MKKIKMPSRRKRSLRRVLIAAVTLFLVNRIFLVGLLFPIQAVRHCEEREGTGRTVVIRRDWAPEIYKTGLVYLTENEKVTMLSMVRLSLYGWIELYGVPVDCTGEDPIHGGWWAMSRQGRDSLLYVFGRVDDPNAARMEVRLSYTDWKEEDHTALTWNSERGDWMEQDGRYYFLFRTYPPFDWTEYHPALDPVAVCWDEAGNEVARVELDGGGSSSYS